MRHPAVFAILLSSAWAQEALASLPFRNIGSAKPTPTQLEELAALSKHVGDLELPGRK